MTVAVGTQADPVPTRGVDGVRHGRVDIVVAIVAGAVVLLLPPRGLAVWLVGPDSVRLAEVVQGVWLLKAALLAHIIALPLLARTVRALPGGSPLLESRAERNTAGGSAALAAVLLLLGLGLALRVIDLGAGLWHDEIATLLDSGRIPPRAIVATYTAQNQHLLYSLLARLTFLVLDESALALRIPAVVLGVASLAAAWWFATLVTSRREALLAMLLLTVSYHHVWFSQNGRGYTGLMLLACVGSGLFLHLLRDDTPNRWRTMVAYGLTMALAAYTHLTAAFVAVAHAMIWGTLAWRRGKRPARTSVVAAPIVAIVLAGTFTIVLYSLVLPQMAETLFAPKAEFAETPWRNPLWLVAETLRGASAGLPGGWLGLVAGLVVAGAGAISYVRRAPGVAAIMMLPVILTAVVLIGLGHNLWPRFFFFGAGFAVLIAVRGVFALARPLPGRWAERVPTAVLVLVAAASLMTVPRAWAPKQDYEGALRWVERERAPSDAVAAAGLAAYAYTSWLDADVQTVTDIESLDAIEHSHARTWMLVAFPTHLQAALPPVWNRIRQEYRTVASFPATVAGGTVNVMVRP